MLATLETRLTDLGNQAAALLPILCPILLGGIAIYLLLPRARPYPSLWGGIAGGLGGVLLVLNILDVSFSKL